MLNEKMIRRMYFAQSQNYYSASKDELLPIAKMAPRHAANAARLLLVDAFTWVGDAGMATEYAQLWITTTPLFQALVKRAGGLVKL